MVVIGVDPHKRTHRASAMDPAGNKVLAVIEIEASLAGYRRLWRWAARFEQRRWAVEGARGLGRHLAQWLVARGERVDDVASTATARLRELSRGGRRKNDVIDAAAAASVAALGGEASPGLERRHIDLVHRTVTVEQQAQVVVGQGRVLGPTKSEAGRLTVAIPDELVRILDRHLANYVNPEPDAVVFTGDKGAPITTQHWSKKFRAAADSAGAEGLHFHDLRHLAGTLAAATGASTRELMARLGHSTPRASLIYQHATEQRDRQIAAGIDAILEAAAKADGANEASIHALETSRRSANQA